MPYNKTKLFPHQVGVSEETKNGIDKHGYHGEFLPMGGGKTKISIVENEILYSEGKITGVVIYTKKSLLPIWEKEFAFHSKLPVVFFRWDNVRDITKKYQREKKEFLSLGADTLPIFLLNIETLSVDPKRITEKSAYSFFIKFVTGKSVMHIVDESSFLKNPSAKWTQNIMTLARVPTGKPGYRMILTGTEISTSVLNIYSQMEFLKENFWGMNYYQFKLKHCVIEQKYYGKTVPHRLPNGAIVMKKIATKTVTGFRKLDELKAKIAPYVSQLKKEDCVKLPPKIDSVIDIEMTPQQRKLYTALAEERMAMIEDDIITSQFAIVIFNYLRQICGGFIPDIKKPVPGANPKADFIEADSEEYPGKILIWCAFNHEIDYLHDRFSRYGAIKYYGASSRYDGATPEEHLQEFENNPEIKYAIMSVQKGAHGKNLQFSSLAYDFSLHTSPELNWQAAERQHRPGQTEIVIQKKLICPGTADERVYKLLYNRREMLKMFRDRVTKQDFFKLI